MKKIGHGHLKLPLGGQVIDERGVITVYHTSVTGS